MENLVITGGRDVYFVPSVNFDCDRGVCELAGESYLEETSGFYAPLVEWLQKFKEEKFDKLVFDFKLTYFNTSSSRCIVDILSALKEIEDEGCELTVNWFYNENEVDIEDIEDFIDETGVTINVIQI